MRTRYQPRGVMLFLLMFLVSTMTLFSVDIADYGFTVVSSFDEQGTTVYVVEDASGNRFEFIGEQVTRRQAQVILRDRDQQHVAHVEHEPANPAVAHLARAPHRQNLHLEALAQPQPLERAPHQRRTGQQYDLILDVVAQRLAPSSAA